MHYHGYEWAGDGRQMAREPERRPVDPQAFRLSELPPMMTGWWLLRPASQIRGTWHTAPAAADWLVERYEAHTPGGDPWLPTDTRRIRAVERLEGASDVVWARWLSDTRWTGHYVVTCPNTIHPALPCPR